ncbi:MAG: MltA domain-containing protein [Pseudomonadota bacterium]
MRGLVAAALLGAAIGGCPVMANPNYTLMDWSDLEGWAHDDHAAALSVFSSTCGDLDDPEWASVCQVADIATDARAFFEVFFHPVLVEDGDPMLFTGYFEPELKGSRQASEDYPFPLYRLPPEVRPGTRWYSRAEIETRGILDGRGLEIAYVDDPVDAFFLQVQGSGRIQLDDGGRIRVGFAGKNGHDYKSVGQELVRRGVFQSHQVSAQVIRNWVRRNPEDGLELLRHNPSFVFFREVNQVPAELGPLGAMNRSITSLRTVAVDPAFHPLGAPVWIEKRGEEPLRRLMIAQDTGSAIKGAQRADIFYGTGRAAGLRAGRIRDGGRMVTLLPIQQAFRLADGG